MAWFVDWFIVGIAFGALSGVAARNPESLDIWSGGWQEARSQEVNQCLLQVIVWKVLRAALIRKRKFMGKMQTSHTLTRSRLT